MGYRPRFFVADQGSLKYFSEGRIGKFAIFFKGLGDLPFVVFIVLAPYQQNQRFVSNKKGALAKQISANTP